MVCVVSATWRRHVGMSVILGGKIPDTTPILPAKRVGMFALLAWGGTQGKDAEGDEDLEAETYL